MSYERVIKTALSRPRASLSASLCPSASLLLAEAAQCKPMLVSLSASLALSASLTLPASLSVLQGARLLHMPKLHAISARTSLLGLLNATRLAHMRIRCLSAAGQRWCAAAIECARAQGAMNCTPWPSGFFFAFFFRWSWSARYCSMRAFLSGLSLQQKHWKRMPKRMAKPAVMKKP